MSRPSYSPATHTRARHPVGTPAPARWWDRLTRHRFRNRLPVRTVIDDATSVAGHYLTLSWNLYAARAAWRYREYTAGPALALATILLHELAPFIPLVDLARPPLAQILVVATQVGLGAGLWFWTPLRGSAPNTRAVHQEQKDLRRRIEPTPKVVAKLVMGHATVTRSIVAGGMELDAYEAKQQALETSYREKTYVQRVGTHTLEIRREHVDLLATPAPWVPQPTPDPWQIPLGHDWDGQPVSWSLLGGHRSLLVAGHSGGGKSTLLNAQIAHLTRIPQLELVIIDPLGGVDLGIWWRHALEVAEDTETAGKTLEWVDDRRLARLADMKTAGHQLATWPRYPIRVLVIDELSVLTHSARLTAEDKRRNIAILEDLLTKGRKTLDVVICATQFPLATVIPTLIRGQFNRRIGLRTEERSQGRIILDTVDVDLSAIPEEHPGRGFLKVGGRITGVRFAGLWETSTPTLTQVANPQAIDVSSTIAPTSPPLRLEANDHTLSPGFPSEIDSSDNSSPTSLKIDSALTRLSTGFTTRELCREAGIDESSTGLRKARYHLAARGWIPNQRRWYPPGRRP